MTFLRGLYLSLNVLYHYDQALETKKSGVDVCTVIPSSIIDEVIEGKHHTFDNQDCLLTFRKLQSVYGKEHFIIEC
jgi:hypothetical protein